MPANAGNFTCSSQVKRSLARFTCVTCSLPVITGKFTCFEAASTSRRTHAHCLRAHVNLPEYHRCFTGSFTCGTHANLPATSMQNCLLLQAKIHATYRQNTGIAGKNTRQTQAKITANAGKNTRTIAGKKTCNSTQNYLQLQAICHHTAGKFTCKLQVSWPASCRWSYLQLACFINCYRVYSAWGACRLVAGKFTYIYR